MPSGCSIRTHANSFGVGNLLEDQETTTAISFWYSSTTPGRKSDSLAGLGFCMAGAGGLFCIRCRGHAYACSPKIQPVHSPCLNETGTHMWSYCRLGLASTVRTCPFWNSHHGWLVASKFMSFGVSQAGIWARTHKVRRCLEAGGTISKSPLARVLEDQSDSNTLGMVYSIAGWQTLVNRMMHLHFGI